MLRYQFYPTLLNEYHRYLANPSKDAFDMLINRINRVPITDPELLKKFGKGISFESAVLKDKPHQFAPELVSGAREMLPTKLKSQQFIQFTHKDIRFYGYADVVGEGRVIDIKTTKTHRPNRHDFNFQNLYLYALKDAGFRQMDYLICDFNKLYVETYDAEVYDFNYLLNEMEQFAAFVEEHKSLITDKKIFIEEIQGGLFA
ncbi:MAG: PD-(D/E)XK nuclease family protein [Spirosomaceae bacterium]|nr:PD-(D/E)XK nuclease family protein [Spirosomataceae bacterium]